MRTTIFLDDHLAVRLREEARQRGQSLSAFLADAGRRALAPKAGLKVKPFKLVTYGRGGPQPGICLDATSRLLSEEDREQFEGRA